MKFWEKLLCGHKWKGVKSVNAYHVGDKAKGELPHTMIIIYVCEYVCEICGKIKKINLGEYQL